MYSIECCSLVRSLHVVCPTLHKVSLAAEAVACEIPVVVASRHGCSLQVLRGLQLYPAVVRQGRFGLMLAQHYKWKQEWCVPASWQMQQTAILLRVM